jgi:hypothetical protein
MSDADPAPNGATPVWELTSETSRSPTLEELLEHASHMQAVRFGGGTLVGECLDTHHPHLPHRVFVEARDRDGEPVRAWLPVLDHLRIRAGAKVMLSKPDNWPEPVVVGVLLGLEQHATQDGAAASDGPSLRLELGQALVITGPNAQPLLQVSATADGPKIELFQADVAIDMPGCVRIGADRIELRSRAGGVDIRSDGDTIVRSRFIRLN